MKIQLVLPLILSVALLFGCGGSKTNQSSVRLINATTDYATLDLYSTDTLLTGSVAMTVASGYVSLDEGSKTFRLKRGGSGTTSLEVSQSVSKDVPYTLLAYTASQQLKTLVLTDNESDPSSGYAKLRLMNLAGEAGSVDVYVSGTNDALTDIAATMSGLTGSSSYFSLGKGTYRIRVTGAGDKSDLRLDIPSVELGDKTIMSLVLTSTSGGVLVDGLMIQQKGAVTPEKNNSVRMRLVAAAAGNGNVAATANGISLSSGLKSPALSAYALVAAGTLATALSINGNSVAATEAMSAPAGSDVSLLVMGDTASPRISLLKEDNRLGTGANARLRLVNALNSAAGNVTLTADYNVVASDIAAGAGSAAANVNAGSNVRVEATTSSSTTPLYLQTDVTLVSTHVYTLFMFGDNASPVGVLRRDR